MSAITALFNKQELPGQKAVIRPLTSSDTSSYRALRQRVLAIGDGKFFSDSFTREAALSDEQWLDWCTEKPEHCIFGAFVDEILSGVVMISQYGPHEDAAVEWEATWLDPIHRGSGITRSLYGAVQRWTESQGYKFVKVFIREDNLRWLEIRRKQGFNFDSRIAKVSWADGTQSDALCFTRDLSLVGGNAENKVSKALHFMEQAHLEIDR